MGQIPLDNDGRSHEFFREADILPVQTPDEEQKCRDFITGIRKSISRKTVGTTEIIQMSPAASEVERIVTTGFSDYSQRNTLFQLFETAQRLRIDLTPMYRKIETEDDFDTFLQKIQIYLRLLQQGIMSRDGYEPNVHLLFADHDLRKEAEKFGNRFHHLASLQGYKEQYKEKLEGLCQWLQTVIGLMHETALSNEEGVLE